mgnify:CR=1 FL=1
MPPGLAHTGLTMAATELPLFPLNTVLFPGGDLPLQIFEVRYLDLMQRCEREGQPFGVVTLRSGQEVRRAPGAPGAAAPAETLADVGTLAHLTQVVRPQAGLMFVMARGGQRFKLEAARQLPHGLWMGDVALLPDDVVVPLPDELAELGPRLRTLLQTIERAEGLPTPIPEADDACWQQAGWVANRWAERLPLLPPDRLRLMQLDNPVWRLELVAEWVDQLVRRQA